MSNDASFLDVLINEHEIKKKKILIAIPCHLRLEILGVQLKYHMEVLSKKMSMHNLNVDFLYIGTNDLEGSYISKTPFFFEGCENVLSKKFNRCVSYALEKNYDFLMTLGSDDLIPFDLFVRLLAKAIESDFLSAPGQLYLFDIETQNVYKWIGYPLGTKLGVGAGRFYSKKLLNALPPNPFGIDKMYHMETTINKSIVQIMNQEAIDCECLSLFEEKDVILCLKSESNINQMSKFKSKNLCDINVIDIHNVIFDWLSISLKNEILELKKK